MITPLETLKSQQLDTIDNSLSHCCQKVIWSNNIPPCRLFWLSILVAKEPPKWPHSAKNNSKNRVPPFSKGFCTQECTEQWKLCLIIPTKSSHSPVSAPELKHIWPPLPETWLSCYWQETSSLYLQNKSKQGACCHLPWGGTKLMHLRASRIDIHKMGFTYTLVNCLKQLQVFAS